MKRDRTLDRTTIVFDLDGTLVDTAPDLHATLNHVLETHQFEPVLPVVSRGFIGQGAKAMLRAGLSHQSAVLPDSDIDRMFDLFLEHYAMNIAVHSKPYEGCVAALSRLSEAGATLAVCTNKTQKLADRLLDQLGLSSRFAIIVGADSVSERKPSAIHLLETVKLAKGNVSASLLVGDSQTDEKAALNAGLPFIYVPFGYGPISPAGASNRTELFNYGDLNADMIADLLRI